MPAVVSGAPNDVWKAAMFEAEQVPGSKRAVTFALPLRAPRIPRAELPTAQ